MAHVRSRARSETNLKLWCAGVQDCWYSCSAVVQIVRVCGSECSEQTQEAASGQTRGDLETSDLTLVSW